MATPYIVFYKPVLEEALIDHASDHVDRFKEEIHRYSINVVHHIFTLDVINGARALLDCILQTQALRGHDEIGTGIRSSQSDGKILLVVEVCQGRYTKELENDAWSPIMQSPEGAQMVRTYKATLNTWQAP